MSKHIFISYSHSDFNLMNKVKNSLVLGHSIPVWTDEGIPQDSPNWLKEIEKALRDAYCVICILTPNTKKSDWVQRELRFAEALGLSKYIVLVEGNLNDSVFLEIATSQVIDLTDDRIYHRSLKRLSDSIRKKYFSSDDSTTDFSEQTAEKARIDIPGQENHKLIVKHGMELVNRMSYHIADTPYSLGRSESNTVIIRDKYISRNHCDFLYTADGMWLRDLESGNGTYVNGERIGDKYLLKDGDEITFARPMIRKTARFRYSFEILDRFQPDYRLDEDDKIQYSNCDKSEVDTIVATQKIPPPEVIFGVLDDESIYEDFNKPSLPSNQNESDAELTGNHDDE